jgi:hypothetical protein
MTFSPDAIIKVRFRTAEEGGRETPIIGEYYSCPLFVGGEGFDCRILLDSKKAELGKWHKLAVKFLHPEYALPKLSPGQPLTLWEGKDIADGSVVEIVHD